MKRTILFLWAILLLITPALAATPGQAQIVLQATEEGYPGACKDVSLGSYAADTIRQAAGTDFAFLPTGLLGLNLQPGPVDDEVLALCFPEDEIIYTVSFTAPELKACLEHSAATLALNESETLDREVSIWDGFLQISGLYIIYDVPAPVGQRLYELKLPDHTEPDLTDESLVFTAALPASLVDGTHGYPVLEPECEIGSLRELVGARIATEGVDTEPDSNRILLYGAYENNIIDAFPPGLIVFVILLFAVFGGHKWRRLLNFER